MFKSDSDVMSHDQLWQEIGKLLMCGHHMTSFGRKIGALHHITSCGGKLIHGSHVTPFAWKKKKQ